MNFFMFNFFAIAVANFLFSAIALANFCLAFYYGGNIILEVMYEM